MHAHNLEIKFICNAMKDLGITARALGAVLPENCVEKTYDNVFTLLLKSGAMVNCLCRYQTNLKQPRLLRRLYQMAFFIRWLLH